MAFPELVGHQLVLIPLLLTRVQLLRQDQEGFFLALQLLLANHELCDRFKREKGRETSLITEEGQEVMTRCVYEGTHVQLGSCVNHL